MKHSKIKMSLLLAGVLLTAPVQMSLSQEVPSAEKIADRRSNYLKDALALTDKQYKKVYDIVLAEENACRAYIEEKQAALPKPEVEPAKPAAEPKDAPDAPDAAAKPEKPLPPAGCPYVSEPRCDYYGGPYCPRSKGYASAPSHKKHGKGAGVKGGPACDNPQMRGFRMGLDSIRNEYNAKLIGVLNAEQTEKYLLISRPGQRPGQHPVPPSDCDRPRPHHHHGEGRR